MSTKRRTAIANQTELAQSTPTPDERWQDADEFRWAARHWATQIGVKTPRIQVRAMTTKWASISSAGQLTLNSELLAMPRELGEFVIVHELVHLLAPNHGRVFTSFLHAYLPDWQQQERALRRYAGRTKRTSRKSIGHRPTPLRSPATRPNPATKPPVLIVDDDPGIRRMLTEVLSLEGYQTRLAEHGGVGLEEMRASKECMVVLLGLMMPEVTGGEVLEVLAADPQLAARHAVVVVSGQYAWATTGRLAEIRRQLDIPYLPKPFHVRQLLEAVEQATRQLATNAPPKATRRRSGRQSVHE